MGKTTMGVGAALIALGVIGYIAGGASSFTAMIPAVFGLALAGLGAWAARGGAAEKNAMHVAAVAGLLGFLAPLGRIIPSLTSGAELGLPFWTNLAMFAICGAFFALCVKSFVDARRARAATAR